MCLTMIICLGSWTREGQNSKEVDSERLVELEDDFQTRDR